MPKNDLDDAKIMRGKKGDGGGIRDGRSEADLIDLVNLSGGTACLQARRD